MMNEYEDLMHNLDEGMFKIIRKRIRRDKDGKIKVQKRVKVATNPKMKIGKSGKPEMMPSSERINRKKGQRFGAKKRKPGMKKSLRLRAKTMLKRLRLGLDKKAEKKDE